MSKTTDQHDTAAPVTEDEATAIDQQQDTQAQPEPVLNEDDAILSAIRGNEEPKPDGEDAPKGDAPKAEPVDPAKPAADPKGGNEPEPKAETNPLDEETPKDYKGRTRENFERLRAEGIKHRERVAELEAQLNEVTPSVERDRSFNQLVAESGGTAEDIGTSIALIRAVNKGTAEEKEGALQIVEAIRGILADQLGKPIDGVDYLADHPDLQKKVAEGDLDPADAREIAVLRRKAKVDGETNAQRLAREAAAREQETSQQAELTGRQQAAASVEQQARAYMQRDGEAAYRAKVTYAQTTFQRINTMSPVPPAQIPALFKELYESPEAQMLADAAAPRSRASAGGARAIMGAGRGGSGQAVPEAQSEEDAVLMALRGQ